MGYEYGDAQNTAVRVLLYQISKKHKFFDLYYKEKTLEYFDYKCPYTDMKLTKDTRWEMDHIIPANKTSCGLHIYGNVLLVSKQANLAKRNQSIEEFLKNEPQKLEKIQKFMQESGYLEIHNQYYDKLKVLTASLYEEIGNTIYEKLNCINTNTNEIENIQDYPTRKTNNKDYTKYNLKLKDQGRTFYAISKSSLPKEVFKYLIENNLLTAAHFTIFSKNNFGRTWLSTLGDLLTVNPNQPNRYKKFEVNNKTYYVSSQWQIDTISKFISYINNEFGNHIKIEESTLKDISQRHRINIEELMF